MFSLPKKKIRVFLGLMLIAFALMECRRQKEEYGSESGPPIGADEVIVSECSKDTSSSGLSISGKIKDAVTGDNLSASLNLLCNGEFFAASSATATDGYSFKNLRATTYTFYSNSITDYENINETTSITASTDDLHLYASPTCIKDTSESGLTISGNIRDGMTGENLSGTVYLLCNGEIYDSSSVTTTGGYSFSNVRPNNYTLYSNSITNYREINETKTLSSSEDSLEVFTLMTSKSTDRITIILSWGSLSSGAPSDLDANLTSAGGSVIIGGEVVHIPKPAPVVAESVAAAEVGARVSQADIIKLAENVKAAKQNVSIASSSKNVTIYTNEFDELAERIIKKNAIRPYPDINVTPK